MLRNGTTPAGRSRCRPERVDGSGKSTLARRLAAEARILADLEVFCSASDRWIIEGCYADVVRASLRWEPELLFMNSCVEVCLRHCRERPWEPHKYRSRQEQDANLAFLLEWVSEYYRRDGSMSLRAHREVFDGYAGKKREIVDEGGA